MKVEWKDCGWVDNVRTPGPWLLIRDQDGDESFLSPEEWGQLFYELRIKLHEMDQTILNELKAKLHRFEEGVTQV